MLGLKALITLVAQAVSAADSNYWLQNIRRDATLGNVMVDNLLQHNTALLPFGSTRVSAGDCYR
jgi:hypothetical protein